MQCEQFEQRLHALLDRRQRPEYDSALVTHSRKCSECSRLLTAQETLFDALACGVPDDEPTDDFESRVVLAAAAVQDSQPRSTLRTLAGCAIAASLLLLLTAQFFTQRDVSPLVASGNLAENAPEDPLGPSTSSPEHGGNNAEQHRAIPPYADFQLGEGRLDLGMIQPLLADFQSESFPPVDQLAVGLRPIASSLSVAIDALRRSFPLGRELRSPDRRADTSQLGLLPA